MRLGAGNTGPPSTEDTEAPKPLRGRGALRVRPNPEPRSSTTAFPVLNSGPGAPGVTVFDDCLFMTRYLRNGKQSEVRT